MAYQAKREADKVVAPVAKEEVKQERKPRSNPFGDAKPTEIKEIEVKTSAATDKKPGAKGEGEDEKPAEKPAEKEHGMNQARPKKEAPKEEAPKAKAAASAPKAAKAKTKAPANAFDLLQGESGSDEEDEE